MLEKFDGILDAIIELKNKTAYLNKTELREELDRLFEEVACLREEAREFVCNAHDRKMEAKV
jgi:hypothetical protein